MALWAGALAFLQGCTLAHTGLQSAALAGPQGRVRGGQQPIVGATVQLYAAGQNGVASAATPLLTQTLRTAADGSFSLAGLYTCPSPSTPVYLVAQGGNPGLYGGSNPSITLMTAIGACSSLQGLPNVALNEVTTVGAVFSLAPFMTSATQVGSVPSLDATFSGAWANALQLADPLTGTAPGPDAVAAFPLPVSKINTLANILAGCVNSHGGSAGDGSLCGQLFAETTVDGIVPGDIASAALALARHPTLNTSRLFSLLGPLAPFDPQLNSPPLDFGLLTATGTPLATPPADGTPNTNPSPAPVTPPVMPPVTPPVSPPTPNVQAISLSLSGSVLDRGRIGAGIVTLPLPAPPGGVSIALSSAAGGVLSLPATLTVAAGQTRGRFLYQGTAAGSTTIFAATDAYGSMSAPLTVQLPVAQANMFGLSFIEFETYTPQVSFGTTRTWDAWPDLDWADTNPALGVYDFSVLDRFIALNQARGKEILYTFGRTPQWASTKPAQPGSYKPGQCAAPDLVAWDAFVRAVVTHAAGRIKYWELWNEPDQAGNYCGDLASMIVMAQHAYPIIKSVDPTAVVLSPSATGGAGASWLANFLNEGGRGSFDVVAFHGYEGTVAEAIVPIVAVFRNAMYYFNIDELPMWDTECSWGNNPINDPAQRAAFVAKYFALQWSSGVDRTLWYAYDGSAGWGRLIDDNGNLAPDGVAYGQVRSWLLGATLTDACAADSNGTWRCGISRSGGYRAQMVWNSSRTANNVAIPAGLTQIRDLSGNRVPFYGGGVSVGNMPLLFESGTP